MTTNKDDLPFAKRYGFESVEIPFQVDGIDKTLRTDIWNAFLIFVYQPFDDASGSGKHTLRNFHRIIWIHFFKNALDDFPDYDFEFSNYVRSHVENAYWPKVYEFFEFVLYNMNDEEKYDYLYEPEDFAEYLNDKLKDNNSAYTLTGNKFIPVTNETEISEIEQTQSLAKSYNLTGVQEHLNTALKLISQKPKPDLRNSIKESISMVEVISRIIEPKENTLGKALNKLDRSQKINSSLKAGFEKLYAYSNDKNGIRHALMLDESIEIEDAKFLLISCSAFTNYLIEKAKKEGLLDSK